ncbi:ATP-binding protein [Planotetraspora thailandica]|uniref:ATP-binding protein n=1 Tax=Planotetraspora thailandica TaxID=487172 RepID=A0A8J3V3W5_9ACTN|nr:ATP-binding protein [Planotetraspora thailandica]GII55645.1 ATP-binding protein [Planotetraspora thailandica]
MSDKPDSPGQLTHEIGFGRFFQSGNDSETTTCLLRPQADSVKTARDVTRSTLREWGLPELSDDAALVVSELVTNAVRYSLWPTRDSSDRDHPITLLLVRIAPHVLLAVSDPSDEVPAPKEPDFISENGRGLYIVETYSQAWGWDALDHGGKAVWALFRAEG